MSQVKLHPSRPAAWIEVEGEDSFTFLQGQCANDLRSNQGEPATYTLWLDRKGKVVADSYVLALGPERFAFFSYFSTAQSLLDRLDPYIIADDVTLRDRTDSCQSIAVWGNDASGLLAAAGLDAPKPGTFVRLDGVFVIPGRRSRGENFDLLFPPGVSSGRMDEILASMTRLGGETATRDQLETERIRSGIPAVPVDIGPGELPQEGGLESEALSYEKGCYLGQEVMARIRSMGQVRRGLALVRLTSPQKRLEPGAVLYVGEREAGRLTSVAPKPGDLALALIRLEFLQKEPRFSLSPGGPPALIVQKERPA